MKAVLYARVSSKEQEDGFSIPAQLKLIKEYAVKNKLKIIKEFIDVETAKQAGRSNFNSMIDFLKNNLEVNNILCEKTDRLYRNFKDYLTIEDLELKIHLVKENEILSKESKSHQKFIHGIKILMAKNYIDNLSEETKKGMLQKANEGYYPSFAPLGYLNIEKELNGRKIKKIKVDQSRFPIIKKMFQLYATGGYSLQKITSLANEEGLRSKKGYKLHKSTIHKILRDPIYYGDFKWNDKIYKGKHPAIISKELFDEVQNTFSRYNKPEKIQKHNFAFTGLLTCAKCGCAITAEIQKDKYVYYHCTHYKGKCGNKFIREENLTEKLGELVKKIKIEPKIIGWLKEALLMSHKDEQEYHTSQIKSLQEQYNKLQHRLDKIYIDKLDEIVTTEFYQEKTNEWKDEQSKILVNIERHKDANTNYFEQGIKILELAQKAYFSYLEQNNTGKRNLLNILLSNCTLNDGNLYPTYRKPFDLLAKKPFRSVWGAG
jgi:DNA invertase Pin-like site-specific DNA recombinase